MSKTETQSKFIYMYAIILILEIGLLHIMTAQVEYDKAAYMGYLFAANFFGSLAAAFGLYHRQFWGWMLGLVIAGASIAGYVWSRTLGMPGLSVEEWFSPYGIVSLSLESAFIFVVLIQPWKISAGDLHFAGNSKFRYAARLVGMCIIILISLLTYQWNVNVTGAIGHHVGSLDQVCRTDPTTYAELESKYGIEVVQVGTSMLGGIVDVRLRIVDADKAHALLQNQAALLVGQEALILAPHMHSHAGTKLKVGKIFIVFFPTEQKIHPGSEVSLVFGPVRVESMVVR